MYIPNEKRYENMIYNRCGKSGLKLSAISLGFWKNFGYENSFSNYSSVCLLLFLPLYNRLLLFLIRFT